MTETIIKKDAFDFLFFYEFEDGREEDALLVGGDDPSTASPLHLAIGIKDAGKIVISPIPDVTRVSSSNYHFKLQFTPGILLQPEQITVESDDWGLEVEGDTILYLLWKGEEVTLDGTNSLELMLNGVMATLALAVRTSQTNVTLSWEFKRGSITVIDVTAKAAPGDSNPYNNTATETLEMIQRQGKANIPLYVGFFSSNRVLNTDNQESNLKLRITNTSESAITFKYDADATNRSQLIVALEVGDDTVPWALGTADQVDGVVVSIAGDKWQPAGPTNKGSTLEWTFSPKSADISLAAKETLVIELSKIVTAHPTGTANLYLRYQYVPGYQDGEFICPIEKAPLVFPETNVGIGTTTPSHKLHVNGGNAIISGHVGIGVTIPKQKLHVAGDYYGKGHMWLYATEGDGKDGTAYVKARDDSKTSTIDLRLRTQEKGHEKDVMHLDSSGNVGIGTTSPSEKLHVNGGNAIFQGGNVDIGTTSPKYGTTTENEASLHVTGDYYGKGHMWLHANEGDGKAGTAYVQARDDSGTSTIDLQLRTQENGKLKDVMRLDSSGNVGIGTDDPKGKLDVNGSIKINGEPAMILRRYSSSGIGEGETIEPNKNYNTGMNSNDWVAVIAGFHIDAGSEDRISGASAYMKIIEGNPNWHISMDGLGQGGEWVSVNVLFIRKEFF